MSTAAAFKSPRLFPWCVTDISGTYGSWSYVDNLTLAQVMAFAYNLETFTLTMSGSATQGALSVDTAGTITSNPPGATNYDRGQGNGMWLPSTAANTVWASWPSAKQPAERICESVDGRICAFSGNHSGDPTVDFFTLFFYLGTDPSNSGKYRIYYYITIVLTDTGGGSSLQIVYCDPVGSSGTLWNSGTINLGGIDFGWESYYDTGATTSGPGSLSATYGDYTY